MDLHHANQTFAAPSQYSPAFGELDAARRHTSCNASEICLRFGYCSRRGFLIGDGWNRGCVVLLGDCGRAQFSQPGLIDFIAYIDGGSWASVLLVLCGPCQGVSALCSRAKFAA